MTARVSDDRDVWSSDDWLRAQVPPPRREFNFLRALGWVIPLMLAAGLLTYFFVSRQTPTYESGTRLVLAASEPTEGEEYIVVDSISALANRQFLGTFSQIIDSAAVGDAAMNAAGVAPADTEAYEVTSTVSPESSSVDILVTGPEAEKTAEVARTVTQQASQRFEEYYSIFDVKVLDPPVPPSDPIAPQPLRTALIVSVLVLGAWLLIIIAFGTNERA
jgi:capsular polysaccharide biosynthesis protein